MINLNPHGSYTVVKVNSPNFFFFYSDNQGEFYTDLVVVLDKNEFESVEDKEVTVASALEETVSGGRLGSLRLDPQSLTMGKIFIHAFKTNF